MADRTVKAVVRVTGDSKQATDAIQKTVKAMQDAGAASVKVTNTVAQRAVKANSDMDASQKKLAGAITNTTSITSKWVKANADSKGVMAGVTAQVRAAGQSYREFGTHAQNSLTQLGGAGRSLGQAIATIVREARTIAPIFTSTARSGVGLRQQLRSLGGDLRNVGLIMRTSLAAGGGQVRQVFVNLGGAFHAFLKSIPLAIRGTVALAQAMGKVASASLGVVAGVGKAGAAVHAAAARFMGFGKSTGGSFATVGTHMAGLAVRLQGMQTGLYAVGGAMTVLANKAKEAFADILNVAGEFEQKMVTLGAVLGKSVSEGTKAELQKFAIQLGQFTPISSNEAATVLNTLIRGGKTVTEVMNGAAYATIALAKANEMELLPAAQAVIQATNVFSAQNLGAVDAVNTMTKVANASSVEVKDLADTMKNAGSAAAVMQVDFKEFMLLAGTLGDMGIKGGEAGTAMRYFFLNLIPTTQKSIRLMREYGLLVIDNAKATTLLGEAGIQYTKTEEGMLEGLWKMVGGVKQLGKSYAESVSDGEPAVKKFQQYLVHQGIVTSKFVDTQTGKLKASREILKELFESFGKLTPVQAADKMGEIFGVRGGFKSAAPLFMAYQENRKKIELEIEKINELERKRYITKEQANAQIAALEKESGNLIDKLMGEMENYGNAVDIMQERQNTWVGSNEYLQSSLEALKVVLGTPLLDTFSPIIRGIGDIINQLTTLAEANPEIVKTLGLISMGAAAFAGLAGPIMVLSAAWPYLMMGLSSMAAGIFPVIGLLTLLAGAVTAVLVAVADPSLGILPAIQQASAALGEMLPAAIAIATQFFNEILLPIGYAIALFFRDILLPAIVAFAGWMIDNLPAAISAASDVLTNVLIPALAMLFTWLAGFIPQALNIMASLWSNLIVPILGFFANLIATVVIPALMQLGSWLGQFLPVAIGILADIWNGVLAPIITFLADVIFNLLLPAFMAVAEWLGSILPPIIAFVSDAVQQFIIPAFQKVIEILGLVLPPILAVVGTILQFLIPAFQMAWNIIAPIVLFLLDVIIMACQGMAIAWGNFVDWWQNGTGLIHDALVFIWEAVTTIFGAIFQAIGWVAEKLGEFFGWLAGASSEAGKKTGGNFTNGIVDGCEEGTPKIGQQVLNIGKGFQSLESPSGVSGYTSGFNWSGGILDGINANIPAIESAVNQVNNLLNNLAMQMESVARAEEAGGDSFFPTDAATKEKRARMLYYLATRKRDLSGNLDIAKKAQFNPFGGQSSGGSGLPTGFDGLGGGDGTSPYEPGGPLEGEYPHAPAGGGGGGAGAREKSAAEVAADLVKKVADGIKSGIEAMRQLAAMVVPANVAEKAQQFAVVVNDIVQAIQKIALQYNSEEGLSVLEATEKFADASGKAMGLLSKGVEAFKAIKDFAAPAKESVAIFVASVNDFMGQFVPMAASFDVEMVAKSQVFADAADKALGLISKAVEGFKVVRGIRAPLEADIQTLVDSIRMLMDKVAHISDVLAPELIDRSAMWAEAAGKVADAMLKAATFLNTLANPKFSINASAERVQQLVNSAMHIMNLLGDLLTANPGWTIENAERVAAFAETAGKVAEALGKASTFLSELAADRGRTKFSSLAERVQELVNAVVDMGIRMRNAVQEEALDNAPLFAEGAAKVIDSLIKVLELLQKLSGAKKLGDSSRVAELSKAVVDMVGMFKSALAAAGIKADETTVEADSLVAQLSETYAKILEAPTKALELLEKLSQADDIFKKNPTRFVGQLISGMKVVLQAFSAARTELEGLVDTELVELSALIGGAVEGLSKPLDLLNGLVSFRPVSDATVDRFISSVRTLVQKLSILPLEIAPALLDIAQEWGEKLGPAIETLGAALDLFINLVGETDEEGKRKGGLRPVDADAIGELTGKLWLLLQKLRTDLLEKIAPEMLDLAKDFGEKVGPAVEMLDKALGLFIALVPDSEGKGGLKPIDVDAIGALVGNLYILLQHYRNVIMGGEFQGDFAERAVAFAGTASIVLDSLNSVLQLAKDIQTANENGAIDKLPEMVQKLATALAAAASIEFPKLGVDMSSSVGQMFASLVALFQQQTNSETPGTIAYYFYGKSMESLLYRMWFAVEGKGGLRPTMRLAFEGMMNEIVQAVQGWATQLKNVWNQVMSDMRTLVSSGLNEIRSMLTSFTQGSITMTMTVDGLNVPALASGGVVTRPTYAFLGEGGEPEAVIPLSKLEKMLGTGGNQTKNKTVNNIRAAYFNSYANQKELDRRQRLLDTSPD